MNDITCKLCNKFLNIKQFSRHLSKIHNQKYEDYVRDNLEDFKYLNWKLCFCGKLFHGASDKCGDCYTKNHKLNEDLFISCKICNEKIHSKVISVHLKKKHNVKFEDYVKENLEDFKKFGWCSCFVCGNLARNKSKAWNKPTCSYECRNKIMSEEYVGREGFIHTNETKKKISIANTGKKHPNMSGNLNPACRPDVAARISKTMLERGVARGSKNPMFGKTHTPESIKKIFFHRPMNKLERLVADTLDGGGIKYKFQFFINDNGICKSYDFKIKNKPLIIEIDGDYWHGNPKLKKHHPKIEETRKNDILKEGMAKKRGYKIIRLWESDIKGNNSIIIDSINFNSSYL